MPVHRELICGNQRTEQLLRQINLIYLLEYSTGIFSIASGESEVFSN